MSYLAMDPYDLFYPRSRPLRPSFSRPSSFSSYPCYYQPEDYLTLPHYGRRETSSYPTQRTLYPSSHPYYSSYPTMEEEEEEEEEEECYQPQPWRQPPKRPAGGRQVPTNHSQRESHHTKKKTPASSASRQRVREEVVQPCSSSSSPNNKARQSPPRPTPSPAPPVEPSPTTPQPSSPLHREVLGSRKALEEEEAFWVVKEIDPEEMSSLPSLSENLSHLSEQQQQAEGEEEEDVEEVLYEDVFCPNCSCSPPSTPSPVALTVHDPSPSTPSPVPLTVNDPFTTSQTPSATVFAKELSLLAELGFQDEKVLLPLLALHLGQQPEKLCLEERQAALRKVLSHFLLPSNGL